MATKIRVNCFVLYNIDTLFSFFSFNWHNLAKIAGVCPQRNPNPIIRESLQRFCLETTLINKKIKFSSYVRKFKMEQLQSHIWLSASSYMGKYLRISSYIRKPFLMYDFATAPFIISLYMRKIWFSFLSVYEWLPVKEQSRELRLRRWWGSSSGLVEFWWAGCRSLLHNTLFKGTV